MSAVKFMNWLGRFRRSRAYIRIRCSTLEGGYHFFVEKRARRHGLRGWMRTAHLPLYLVIEMEVEARRYAVESMLADLEKGPPGSVGNRADVQWKTYRGTFQDFRVTA